MVRDGIFFGGGKPHGSGGNFLGGLKPLGSGGRFHSCLVFIGGVVWREKRWIRVDIIRNRLGIGI